MEQATAMYLGIYDVYARCIRLHLSLLRQPHIIRTESSS
jgi:hypothetical protein